MSDRNMINGVEVHGDVPLFYKELENQGLVPSEDYVWLGFEIKDIDHAFSAFEQDIKNKCKKLYQESEDIKNKFKDKDIESDTQLKLFIEDHDFHFFDFTKFYSSTPMFNVFLGEPFVRDEDHEKRIKEDPEWSNIDPWRTFSKYTTLSAANYMYNNLVFATHAFFQAIKDDIEWKNGIMVIKPGHTIISSRI